MQVTFSSHNLPSGEYAIWGHRDNGTSRALGGCHRTRYGQWQICMDNRRGGQIVEDFRTLAEARTKAKSIWQN